MSKNAICSWDFTLKKTDDIDENIIKNILKEYCKNYAFQLEKGETGYIHYQGRISLKIKSRVGPPLFNAHWTPTSNENKSNNFYVIKSDTRILGPWTDKDRDIYIPKQYRNIELYE